MSGSMIKDLGFKALRLRV